MTHELKIWPEYFELLIKGIKNFEIRLNDRQYSIGDILILKEYDKKKDVYSGRTITKEIINILPNSPFLLPGYVLLILSPENTNEMTDNWYQFVHWFPEISHKLLKNVTFKKIILFMDDGSVMGFVRNNNYMEDAAFEAFIKLHPREGYELHPQKFLDYLNSNGYDLTHEDVQDILTNLEKEIDG